MLIPLSTGTGMSDLLTKLTTVFTSIMGKIPDIAAAITGNDILLLGIGIFFAGTIVAFFVRLLRST